MSSFQKYFFLFIFIFCGGKIFSQNIGINTTGNSANTSAGLDVDFTNKGLLIPRVALTSSTDNATISSPATSLIVYCTGTGGLSPAGYYYNSGTSGSPVWVQLLNGGTSFCGTAAANYVTKFTSASAICNSIIYDNGTNVGIGTISPGYKLDLVDNTLNGVAARFIQTNVTNSNGVIIQTQTTSALDAALIVYSNAGANNLFTIRNTGNVGIGTTTPGSSLEVKGTGATVFRLWPAAATDNNVLTFGAASATLNRALIYSTGSLGDVNGDLRFAVGLAGTAVDPAMVIKSTGAISFNGVTNYGTSGQVLTSNGNTPPTWTNGPSAAGSGRIVLLYDDETSYSNTIAANPAGATTTYTVPANSFSYIKVESDYEFDNSGAGPGKWEFDFYYAGVLKKNAQVYTLNIASWHSGSFSYMEAMPAGGVVNVAAKKNAAGGTWWVKGFRVYGIY